MTDHERENRGSNFVDKVLLHRHKSEVLTGGARIVVFVANFLSDGVRFSLGLPDRNAGLERAIARHCTLLRLATS